MSAEVDAAPIPEDAPEAPVTWRRRMERQALRLWRFLMKGDDYVPLTATRKAALVVDAEASVAPPQAGAQPKARKKRGDPKAGP